MRTLLALALVASIGLAPVAAETTIQASAASPANIHFRLTMLETDAAGNATEQTLEALASPERDTRTNAGWRVPIAIGGAGSSEQGQPNPTFRYQSLGVEVALRGRSLAEDRVRASGRVEITGVDPQAAEAASPSRAPNIGAPQIGTFSHSFEATLLDAAPTTLVSVPRPGGGSVELTLTASIQR